jgi:hypothetical protein
MDNAIILGNKPDVFTQLRLLGNTQAEKDRTFLQTMSYASFRQQNDAYLDIAKDLLADGANMYAAPGMNMGTVSGSPKVIRFLHEQKFDLNTQDADGKTLAHWAVIMGYPESIKVLAQYRANFELQDKAGVTPLGHAVYLWAGGGRFTDPQTREKGETMTKVLIKSGANVNGRFSEAQSTALFEAARFNREDIVRYLVSVGANPLIRDKNGVSVEAELQDAKSTEDQKEYTRQKKLAEAKNGLFSRNTLMGVVAIAGETANNYASMKNNTPPVPSLNNLLAQPSRRHQPTLPTPAANSVPDQSWRACGIKNKCLAGDGYSQFCSGPFDPKKPMCDSECAMSSGVFYHDTTKPPGNYVPGNGMCPVGSCNVYNEC